MISGQAFENEILAYWGDRFGCSAQDLTRVGSLLLADKEHQNTGNVLIYHVGSRSIVQLDPVLMALLHLEDRQVLVSSISQADLAVILRLGMKHSVRLTLAGSGSYFYLEPLLFKPFHTDVPGDLIRLDPVIDRELIAVLCQTCTDREVEAAEMADDQPDDLIFGQVWNGQLLSYAGFRTWQSRFADIGVLTHPSHRNRGLARAGTSMLCDWCFAQDLIPMYRVEAANLASQQVPSALGFTRMVAIEILKVVA